MFTVTLITTTKLQSGYAKRRVLSGHRPVEKYYKIEKFTGVIFSILVFDTPHKLVCFKHFTGVVTGHRTGQEQD